MKLKDFYTKIQEHDQLDGAYVIEECDQIKVPSVLIVNKVNPALKTQIAVKTIIETDWETLEAICLGKEEPSKLSYVSRIVGYYSNIGSSITDTKLEMWNKSKIGELKDRMKGEYAISA